jgi:hypothetical protein
MRTTLDIADDVLAAAKDLARAEGRSMGDVISELARRGLTTPQGYPAGMAEPQSAFLADDWLTFPRRDGLPVTSDVVRQIQDDLDLEDAEAFDHERQAPRPAPSRSVPKG